MKHIGTLLCLAALAACTAKESAAHTASGGAAPGVTTAGDTVAKAPGHASAAGAGTVGRTVGNQQPQQRPLGDKSERATPDLTRSVEYYDGEFKRTAWISTELLFEAAPSEEGRTKVLELDASAQERPLQQRGVRVWRVRGAGDLEGVTRGLAQANLRFSPVLHDGASSASPISALPGGVVATFDPSWDRARIDAWLAARKLAISEDVVPESNMFLIDSAPGLAAITLANELHECGELVGCTPNVWREASTR